MILKAFTHQKFLVYVGQVHNGDKRNVLIVCVGTIIACASKNIAQHLCQK